MYQTTDNYKSKILLPSTKHALRIYINDVKVEDKYIKDIDTSGLIFPSEKLELGTTVARGINLQINKLGLPETIEKVYIESGIPEEIIPIGTFRLDDPVTINDRIGNLKLIDDMVKFEFNYNGKTIIDERGYAESIEVLQDICNKAEVELRFYFFFKYA